MTTIESHSRGKAMTLRCVPEEPTMGQWDDFCKVHSVPFDEFERAYKAMIAPPPPQEIEEALELAKLATDLHTAGVIMPDDWDKIAHALRKSWGRE